ncbi:MAG TPA: hypothetical protein VF144_17505 [Chitinophagaceae bacterium]
MDRQLLDQEKNGLDRAWEFTKEINENIRHYNEHQTKYRTLASQWLIAAMAGVGFLFSANTGFPFDNLILIMLISLISALGILQLWRIDLVVFQRIIGSFFAAGIELEKKYPDLPKIKETILDRVPHKNAGQNLFYFYYFIIALFLFLTFLAFIYSSLPNNISQFFSLKTIKLLCLLCYIAILTFLFKYMWRLSNAETRERK